MSPCPMTAPNSRQEREGGIRGGKRWSEGREGGGKEEREGWAYPLSLVSLLLPGDQVILLGLEERDTQRS